MDTLFYANEIRPTRDIAVDGADVSPKEIQMAVSLIENSATASIRSAITMNTRLP